MIRLIPLTGLAGIAIEPRAWVFREGAENANSKSVDPGCSDVPHHRTRVCPTRQARSSRFDSLTFPPRRETPPRSASGPRKPRTPARPKSEIRLVTPRFRLDFTSEIFLGSRGVFLGRVEGKRSWSESADWDPPLAAPPPRPLLFSNAARVWR